MRLLYIHKLNTNTFTGQNHKDLLLRTQISSLQYNHEIPQFFTLAVASDEESENAAKHLRQRPFLFSCRNVHNEQGRRSNFKSHLCLHMFLDSVSDSPSICCSTSNL